MSTFENTDKIIKFIDDKYKIKDLNDDSLVSIAIHIFDLLNLQTVSENAKSLGKTDRGVRKFSKNIIKINQFTFVKNNE
jgi:predicted transcriptional regulator